MKKKSLKIISKDQELHLSKKQQLTIKGGDDDVLLNTGSDIGMLNFGG